MNTILAFRSFIYDVLISYDEKCLANRPALKVQE